MSPLTHQDDKDFMEFRRDHIIKIWTIKAAFMALVNISMIWKYFMEPTDPHKKVSIATSCQSILSIIIILLGFKMKKHMVTIIVLSYFFTEGINTLIGRASLQEEL